MDWLLLIGLAFLLLIAGVATFYLHAFVARIREEFRATLPDLRITNFSAMSSGNVLTLYPELENVGHGVAYDCTLHMGGWDGHYAVKKVRPSGPRAQKHVVSIVLGPDAAIRNKAMADGHVRLRYQDRWGQKYDCWYQVKQTAGADPSLHDIQIDLENPELAEPNLSFLEMRRLLRSGIQPD